MFARWVRWGAAMLVMTGVVGAGVRTAAALPAPRGELEFWPGTVAIPTWGNVVVLSSNLGLSTFLDPQTILFGTFGASLAVAAEAPADVSHVRAVIANPSIGLARRLGKGLVLRASVTLPLATRGAWGDALGETAEVAARGLRGHVDPWLWLADHFAAVGTVQWSLPVGSFLFELQPSIALMLPTRRLVVDAAATEDEATTAVDRGEGLAVQVRARVAARLWDGLWLAVGAAFVWTPTVTVDSDQWSVAPELRWVFDDASHFGVSAMFNLDAPWGPSFADTGYFGLRVGGSWRF